MTILLYIKVQAKIFNIYFLLLNIVVESEILRPWVPICIIKMGAFVIEKIES